VSRTLWIKEPYLQDILQGEKTVEVRVGYPNILRLKAGDMVMLNDRYAAKVRRVAHYPSFVALLEAEDPRAIAPNLPAESLLAALRSIYPPEKELLGAVALELETADAAAQQR